MADAAVHEDVHAHKTRDKAASREAPTDDRRQSSYSKHRGGPKKGGGGGKGTWGKPGDELKEDIIDPADPIYDAAVDDPEYVLVSRSARDAAVAAKAGVATSMVGSPPRHGYMDGARAGGGAGGGDGKGRMTLASFKTRIIPVIEDYLNHESVDEVAASLEELSAPFFHFELVKRAITIAMDKADRERELVSKLISNLYSRALTTEQIGKAFERLFELADDLKLDIPDAHNYIAAFLARAVADEVLPPAFLSDKLVEDLGGPIIEAAKLRLSMKHGMARLEHVWGPGAEVMPVEELKGSLDMLIKEYYDSSDIDEVSRSLRELNVQHFHHEFVKRTLTSAIERTDREADLAAKLLNHLVGAGMVTEVQAQKGFARTREVLPDLSLDNPSAPASFATLVEACRTFLGADFDAAPPTGPPAPAAE
uniref:MI domain-containing protein n=1 Tax=Bicosoecida sp. CB-2014 TaxID=1486930 RepID=A0A6T6W0K3_9STRA